MSIVICIGRPSIEKTASGEPCDVGQGVTLLAADDLFHANPYAEIDRLRAALEAAKDFNREYETEYAGRVYSRCTACDAALSENAEHRPDCAWKLIDAALRPVTT